MRVLGDGQKIPLAIYIKLEILSSPILFCNMEEAQVGRVGDHHPLVPAGMKKNPTLA
jgi:hypothetical protein